MFARAHLTDTIVLRFKVKGPLNSLKSEVALNSLKSEVPLNSLKFEVPPPSRQQTKGQRP